MILLLILGGLEAGISSAWGGLLSQILENAKYSSTYIGYSGFGSNLSGLVGGIAMGLIADKCYPRHKKELLLVMFLISCVMYFWF